METALDVNTYKYKINGVDTILWRPVDKDLKKFGLFQQDKNGQFTISVLNKYYNLPPHNKSKFNSLYEQAMNKECIIEISLKDIAKKVKSKLKKFRGEVIKIFKNDDDSFNLSTFDSEESEEISKRLKKKKIKIDIHHMKKNELKLLLSYLWPHAGPASDSEELNVNKVVDDMSNEKTSKNIYVDMEALNFLKTGWHGLA